MEQLFSEGILVKVLLFLIPGLIARWMWRSVIVSPDPNEKTSLLSALVASAFVYAPCIPFIYLMHSVWKIQETAPNRFALFLFGLVFVWPILAGLGAAKVMHTKPWQRLRSWLGVRSPEPRAWDTFFARRQSCFVRVAFQDDEVVGGLFYGERSAVSSFPAKEDLFIEHLYYLEPETKKFIGPAEESMGCWIDMERVKYLEFFEIPREDSNNAKEDGKLSAKTLSPVRDAQPETIGLANT